MTPAERNLCEQLYLQRKPYHEFLKEYPRFVNDDYLLNELNNAYEGRDAEALRYILVIASYHGYTNELGSVLSRFLLEGWHKEHEDITRVIQFKTPISEAVDILSAAIKTRFEYMFEQDDYYPFVRKCLNAIRSIGGENARNALEEIAANATDQEIKELAARQLAKI